jgi:hypothetical protein
MTTSGLKPLISEATAVCFIAPEVGAPKSPNAAKVTTLAEVPDDEETELEDIEAELFELDFFELELAIFEELDFFELDFVIAISIESRLTTPEPDSETLQPVDTNKIAAANKTKFFFTPINNLLSAIIHKKS